LAALSLLSLEILTPAQETGSPITKEQALSQLREPARDWREVISDEGRFRITFPGGTIAPDRDVISMHGFKLVRETSNWSAMYSDLSRSLDTDAQIRDAYHRSMLTVVKNGAKLISQRDVVLNGRLGDEVIILGLQTKTFMRAFLVGKRLYSLSVDIKDGRDERNEIPKDVQQFFDSFTFWVA